MTDMTGLDDAAIERILTMVDASARTVAEDEHEELFEEFAEEMRAGRRVPGAGEFFDDLSGAPAVDTHVYLTIGLSVLGQIAFTVLSTATEMAVQRGVRDAVGYLKRCLRGDATSGGTGTEGGENEDSAAGLARRVTVELRLPPEVDPATVRAVVRIQAEALIRSDSADSADVAGPAGPAGPADRAAPGRP